MRACRTTVADLDLPLIVWRKNSHVQPVAESTAIIPRGALDPFGMLNRSIWISEPGSDGLFAFRAVAVFRGCL